MGYGCNIPAGHVCEPCPNCSTPKCPVCAEPFSGPMRRPDGAWVFAHDEGHCVYYKEWNG